MAIRINNDVVIDNSRNITGNSLDASSYLNLPDGNTAARPGSPATGSIRYNTTGGEVEYYDGTTWKSVASAINFTSSTIAVTNSDPSAFEYINISSTGNTEYFGNAFLRNNNYLYNTFGSTFSALFSSNMLSSSTRGIFLSLTQGSPFNYVFLRYLNLSTQGEILPFMALDGSGASFHSPQGAGVCSSSTRGIWAGFTGGPGSPVINNISYTTIATVSTGIDFGDLTVARSYIASCSSTTRGIFAGGSASPVGSINTIDYITIATTGNAIDFGDRNTLDSLGSLAACSSNTRGLFAGGTVNNTINTVNAIDYITIATTGNSIDFGDLTIDRRNVSATSSSTRGVFMGGSNFQSFPGPSLVPQNIIDYVTIATTGNAIDFGDLSSSKENLTSGSNCHGGLA